MRRAPRRVGLQQNTGFAELATKRATQVRNILVMLSTWIGSNELCATLVVTLLVGENETVDLPQTQLDFDQVALAIEGWVNGSDSVS